MTGGNIAGGRMPLQLRHVGLGFPGEGRVGQAAVRPDDDADVVQRAVGVDELRADGAHAGPRDPADHVLQPAGFERVDVVVEVEDERRVDQRQRQVHQVRIVERRRPVRRPHHAAAHVGAPLDRVEVAQHIEVARVVVHDDQFHVAPVHRLAEQLHAFLEQVEAVAGRDDDGDGVLARAGRATSGGCWKQRRFEWAAGGRNASAGHRRRVKVS